MARKPDVRYFPSRGGYYFQLGRKQYHLATGPDDKPTGPTFLKAVGEYKRILQLAWAPDAKSDNTLAVIFELFLRHVSTRRKPGTYEVYAQHLNAFGHFRPSGSDRPCGELRVRELKFTHVEEFCDAMRRPGPAEPGKRRRRPWGDATVRTSIVCVCAALNWAARPGRGLIPENPVRGVEKPRARSRGAEKVVTPELHRRILERATPGLRELAVALENTGARPGELAAATAADWNEALGALVYLGDGRRAANGFAHKTSRTGKDRAIFFTGPALALVRDLVRRHPAGKLFRPQGRGVKGRGWTVHSIYLAFARLGKKLGVPGFSTYSYRHTYITRSLEAGAAPAVLAELVGNSPEIIFKHYSHVDANLKALRSAAEAIHARTAPWLAPVAEAVGLLEQFMASQDPAKLDQALAKLHEFRDGNAGSLPAVLPFDPSGGGQVVPDAAGKAAGAQ